MSLGRVGAPATDGAHLGADPLLRATALQRRHVSRGQLLAREDRMARADVRSSGRFQFNLDDGSWQRRSAVLWLSRRHSIVLIRHSFRPFSNTNGILNRDCAMEVNCSLEKTDWREAFVQSSGRFKYPIGTIEWFFFNALECVSCGFPEHSPSSSSRDSSRPRSKTQRRILGKNPRLPLKVSTVRSRRRAGARHSSKFLRNSSISVSFPPSDLAYASLEPETASTTRSQNPLHRESEMVAGA